MEGEPLKRRCVFCREIKDVRELMRIAASKDGLKADPLRNKEGRGAYVCRTLRCIEGARDKGSLQRSLKRGIPAELFDEIKKESGL